MEYTEIKMGKKKTKIPTYVGFGKLDRNSIESNKNFYTANYLLEGHLVHKIKFVGSRFILSSHWGKENLSTTAHFSFPDALNRNILTINSATDSRFRYINDCLNKNDDVYFQTPYIPAEEGRSIMACYPAGLMFCLRYIYYEESRSLKRLLADIEANKFEHLNINRMYDAVMYYHYKTNIIPAHQIKIIDFITPLAFVLDSVNIIRDYNIILPGQENRLIIQDYSRVLSFDLEFFFGSEHSDFYSYGILYNKPSNYDEELEYHVGFINKSREMLERREYDIFNNGSDIIDDL